MFRPPPEYFWRSSKQKYEKQFRRKAPQWVLTLDRDQAKNLFGVCCRIGLKLHPEVFQLLKCFQEPAACGMTSHAIGLIR